MRALLPRVLYPGRQRVGRPLAQLPYDPRVEVYDGVDWYVLPSYLGARRLIRRFRPDVIVFQWWSGTTAHTYLLLALLARKVGARLVVEFHEIQDTAELRVPFVASYTSATFKRLIDKADGFIVHSTFDRGELERTYDLGNRPVRVVSHGPYNHHAADREAGPPGICRLLYFGTIRRYKGLENLVAAFDALSPEEAAGYRLTVVGETWEGWTKPLEMIEESRHRELINVVNHYVSDDEITAHYAATDLVVLPYLRSSASGPLHIAMSNGLPVVVTSVGGLREAAAGYEGAVLCQPGNPTDLLAAIRRARHLVGRTYRDDHSWSSNVEAILELACPRASMAYGEESHSATSSGRSPATRLSV